MTEPQAPYRYQVVDHAADKAATAYGETPDQVFAAAAWAMFDIMVDLATVRARVTRRIALERDFGDELLHEWLDELLFLFDTERLVPNRFSVQVECPPDAQQKCRRVEPTAQVEGEPWRLRATVGGEIYHPGMVRRGAAVKAVTYHNFGLRPPESAGGDWVATMVFDV